MQNQILLWASGRRHVRLQCHPSHKCQTLNAAETQALVITRGRDLLRIHCLDYPSITAMQNPLARDSTDRATIAISKSTCGLQMQFPSPRPKSLSVTASSNISHCQVRPTTKIGITVKNLTPLRLTSSASALLLPPCQPLPSPSYHPRTSYSSSTPQNQHPTLTPHPTSHAFHPAAYP